MSEFGPFGDVTVDFEDEFVATVEIHRPPHNYLDAAVLGSLVTAFETLNAYPQTRAIVLCSEGKNFCAGARIETHSRSGGMGAAGEVYEQAVRLFSTHVPVVAAVQGAAVGGGLGLALMPDFRVAAPEARFSANFARLGFHHGFGLSVTLPSVVGQQSALEMLYTGRRVKGEEALTMGLCEQLVPLDRLRMQAKAMANEIAASAPLAVLSIRQTMRGDLADQVDLATQHERAEQNRLVQTADFTEGVEAVSQRRSPSFNGR